MTATIAAASPHAAPVRRLTNHRLWIVGFAIWTVLGVLAGAQHAAWQAWRGGPADWWGALRYAVPDWWTCGLFTPAMYWLALRFPIRGGRWWSVVPVHLLGAIAFVFGKMAIWMPLARLLDPQHTRTYLDWVVGGFYFDFLGYWSAIGVIYAWEYHAESRRREVESARLDGALRTAELENLRSQLQPHFLFNALQSISTLIHRDPAAADRMLTDLSELLRGSLAHAAAQEVALRDELAFLRRYLDVMRVRFGDRLTVALDVDDALLDALVPSLLLQPLVENAIRHGIADRAEGGRVAIAARADGDRLVLDVADDGPGMPASAAPGGIGLGNTRERLGRLYGPAASVATRSTSGAGTTVTLTVPLRRRPA